MNESKQPDPMTEPNNKLGYRKYCMTHRKEHIITMDCWNKLPDELVFSSALVDYGTAWHTHVHDELNNEKQKALQDARANLEAAHEADKARAVQEARLHELMHMKFIDANGNEIYTPYVQFRSTVDGLLFNWEDRIAALSPQPAPEEGKEAEGQNEI